MLGGWRPIPVFWRAGLWNKLSEIDADGDHRLSQAEFVRGSRVVGLPLSSQQAAAEFKRVDSDGGGTVLFDEFCGWAAKYHLGASEGTKVTHAPGRQPVSPFWLAGVRRRAAASAPSSLWPHLWSVCGHRDGGQSVVRLWSVCGQIAPVDAPCAVSTAGCDARWTR